MDSRFRGNDRAEKGRKKTEPGTSARHRFFSALFILQAFILTQVPTYAWTSLDSRWSLGSQSGPGNDRLTDGLATIRTAEQQPSNIEEIDRVLSAVEEEGISAQDKILIMRDLLRSLIYSARHSSEEGLENRVNEELGEDAGVRILRVDTEDKDGGPDYVILDFELTDRVERQPAAAQPKTYRAMYVADAEIKTRKLDPIRATAPDQIRENFGDRDFSQVTGFTRDYKQGYKLAVVTAEPEEGRPMTYFFDVGNVLCKRDMLKAAGEFAEYCADESVRAEDIRDFIEGNPEEGGSKVFLKMHTGEKEPQDMFDELKGEFGLERNQAGEEFDFGAFVRIWNITPEAIEGMHERANGLLDAGNEVYIISDANTLHLENLREKFPLFRRVTGTITSLDEGHLKAGGPALILKAVIMTGAHPGGSFYVDDKDAFAEQARRIGMAAHTFSKEEGAVQLTAFIPQAPQSASGEGGTPFATFRADPSAGYAGRRRRELDLEEAGESGPRPSQVTLAHKRLQEAKDSGEFSEFHDLGPQELWQLAEDVAGSGGRTLSVVEALEERVPTMERKEAIKLAHMVLGEPPSGGGPHLPRRRLGRHHPEQRRPPTMADSPRVSGNRIAGIGKAAGSGGAKADARGRRKMEPTTRSEESDSIYGLERIKEIIAEALRPYENLEVEVTMDSAGVRAEKMGAKAVYARITNKDRPERRTLVIDILHDANQIRMVETVSKARWIIIGCFRAIHYIKDGERGRVLGIAESKVDDRWGYGKSHKDILQEGLEMFLSPKDKFGVGGRALAAFAGEDAVWDAFIDQAAEKQIAEGLISPLSTATLKVLEGQRNTLVADKAEAEITIRTGAGEGGRGARVLVDGTDEVVLRIVRELLPAVTEVAVPVIPEAHVVSL